MYGRMYVCVYAHIFCIYVLRIHMSAVNIGSPF